MRSRTTDRPLTIKILQEWDRKETLENRSGVLADNYPPALCTQRLLKPLGRCGKYGEHGKSCTLTGGMLQGEVLDIHAGGATSEKSLPSSPAESGTRTWTSA